MPYPGTMTTLLAAARIAAASSGVALRTGRASGVPAATGCTCPKAPNKTLEKDRFMAFDMLTERMKPDAPSSAPATMSSLLSSTKPMAAAESGVGVQQRDHGRHVGAADGDDHEHAEYQRDDHHRRIEAHVLGMQHQHHRDSDRDPQEAQIDDVLSFIGCLLYASDA